MEPLDRYLKQQAGQDARKRVSAPYVMVSQENRIAGYYTLASASIRVDDLPSELLKKLNPPRYNFLPATLIGRLARDLSFYGKGMGELLLMDALRLSFVMSNQIASFAVLVDAKDDKAAGFYRGFGFVNFVDSPGRLFLPMKTVAALWPPAESDSRTVST